MVILGGAQKVYGRSNSNPCSGHAFGNNDVFYWRELFDNKFLAIDDVEARGQRACISQIVCDFDTKDVVDGLAGFA